MSSSSVIIRRLHCADVLQLRKLNALFAGAFGEQETYGGELPSDAYLQGLLAKERVIAIVAVTGDEVIGGLVAYELDKFERMRREFYIYDLAVGAVYRRGGIATDQAVTRDSGAARGVGHLCSGRPWRCARHCTL
jgi:aminoglycoside 3-N-acetyltransferase I